jgi:nitroimidazol reductase NimA-like FMN-containing flavoprotein (pyridoxamine 5'-phosphate oxidase superfamily)
MPAYGVDTPEWSALPWSWAAEHLVPARNYWVVTVSAGGRPHALPVWGVWDDTDHRFAFSCAPDSRKSRNLSANDRVVVMPESTIECVSVEGKAQLVPSVDRQDMWIERYLDKYQALAPDLTADFIRENRFIEVVPDRAFAIIEREDEFATRATRWVFR